MRSSRKKSVEIKKVLSFSNSFVEIENTCSDTVYPEYLSYLEDIKNMAPYLLFGNKIS